MQTFCAIVVVVARSVWNDVTLVSNRHVGDLDRSSAVVRRYSRQD